MLYPRFPMKEGEQACVEYNWSVTRPFISFRYEFFFFFFTFFPHFPGAIILHQRTSNRGTRNSKKPTYSTTSERCIPFWAQWTREKTPTYSSTTKLWHHKVFWNGRMIGMVRVFFFFRRAWKRPVSIFNAQRAPLNGSAVTTRRCPASTNPTTFSHSTSPSCWYVHWERSSRFNSLF